MSKLAKQIKKVNNEQSVGQIKKVDSDHKQLVGQIKLGQHLVLVLISKFGVVWLIEFYFEF